MWWLVILLPAVQETHITNVLSAIRERRTGDSPVAMPTRIATRGFPTVHELDWKSVGGASSLKPKKSLFACHYDNHTPEFFGMTSSSQTPPVEERDKIQPFILQPSTKPHPPPLHDPQHKATPTERDQFASTASEAWSSLLRPPSLVSGEGLVRAGVSVEVARQEVGKIHQENMERLATVTQEELLAERQRVEGVLGNDLVAFLRKRSRRKEERVEEREVEREDVAERSMEGGGVEMEGGEGNGVMEEEEREATGTVAPHGWLHMDVVEKEKMEWMTDVLPENTASSHCHSFNDRVTPSLLPTAQDGGPVRFSLDGLVIPRGTVLPSHLALHHHGNEPAVSCTPVE